MSASLRIGFLVAFAALLFGGAANAATIDYIFTGTGTGTLNGTPFSGNFTLTDVGNTTAISSGGGEFFNAVTGSFSGVFTATLTGTQNVIDNTASPGYVGFAEFSPDFAVEATINSAFESYELATALALTIGTPNPPTAATFSTTVGNLVFTDISALNFQATIPSAVPEPASLAILGTALAGFGLIRRRRKRA